MTNPTTDDPSQFKVFAPAEDGDWDDDLCQVVDQLQVGDVVYCGNLRKVDPTDIEDTESVIDDMACRIADYIHEDSDPDSFIDRSTEAVNELKSAIIDWVERHVDLPMEIVNVHEYTLTHEDIDGEVAK